MRDWKTGNPYRLRDKVPGPEPTELSLDTLREGVILALTVIGASLFGAVVIGTLYELTQRL